MPFFVINALFMTFYVLLTSPMWVDNGDWIEKYQKYWIFIDDNVKIYNF